VILGKKDNALKRIPVIQSYMKTVKQIKIYTEEEAYDRLRATVDSPVTITASELCRPHNPLLYQKQGSQFCLL